MTNSADLMTKKKILDVIQRMPEDGTIDDAIQRLELLKAVAQGMKDCEEGRVHDHDEVFAELLNENARNSSTLERSSKLGSKRNPATDRKGSTKRSRQVRSKA
jgi:hypothetical protein